MTEMDIDRNDSAIVTGVDQFDTGKIENIGEYVGPDELLKDLIERVRRYHPSDDISLITKAYGGYRPPAPLKGEFAMRRGFV